MGVDVGIKELEEQRVELGMDEARLRQQFLRCCLIERHGVRREVREDFDPLTDFQPATWMDGQALEIEEDLYMMLGELDS
jgi:hypothetical protein